MRMRGTCARLVAGGAAGVALVGLFGAPAWADPPGNNGTVKIDGVPWDQHPDNESHVDCVFQVDFYGFDAGRTFDADVEFAVQPPTGRQVILTDVVPIGEDSHAGGGSERGLDAERTYDLTSKLVGAFEPHPQQGYHVKLTVHADGSQGGDVKHKVFWVDCPGGQAPAPAPASTAGAPAPTPSSSGSVAATRVTNAPVPPPAAAAPAEVEGASQERMVAASRSAAASAEVFAARTAPGAADATARPDTRVLGREIERAGHGRSLAFTGSDVARELAAAAALLASGGAALVLARRRRTS